jgi:hypothetical protein
MIDLLIHINHINLRKVVYRWGFNGSCIRTGTHGINFLMIVSEVVETQ